MSAPQFHFAAAGIDRSFHPAFLVAQGALAIRAFLLHRVGLLLPGFLHQQPLQFQRRLTDVLFDKTQVLFGMLLHPRQGIPEILAPAPEILFEQAVGVPGHYLLDQGVEV